MPDDRKLVYSSDGGFVAPEARRAPHAQTARVPDDGVIRVAREKRRGGVMSIVTGLSDSELAQTAKDLKRLCGSGGTSKNGVVEIQGDHRAAIVAWFAKQGRTAKVAGG
jgi:translation initiation factor 1